MNKVNVKSMLNKKRAIALKDVFGINTLDKFCSWFLAKNANSFRSSSAFSTLTFHQNLQSQNLKV